jgi:3-oxoacyl-[acyl-carrier-protein] synthase III
MQKSFNLSDEDCTSSRATLYRYGNTSTSSVWYELKYIELAGKLKKGQKVWFCFFLTLFHKDLATVVWFWTESEFSCLGSNVRE